MSATAQAELNFTPSIRLSETYTDNIALAPVDSTEEEWVTSVMPGFVLDQSGQRLDVALQYQLEALFFAEEDDRDEVYHQVQLDSTLALVQDAFFLAADGRLDQVALAPEDDVAFNNIFITSNRTDATSWSVNPYIDRDFGSTVNVSAGYSYGEVRYDDVLTTDVSLGNLEETRIDARIGSPDAGGRRLSWGLAYRETQDRYDAGLEFEYAQAELQLGYRLSPRFELLARGGSESDVIEDATDRGVETDFWSAGFAWEPGSNHRLELLVGERYFGDTVSVTYGYSGRVLSLGADYIEDTRTVGVQDFARTVFDPEPGEIEPGLIPLTPDIFVSKLGRAFVQLTGRRTDIRLSAYDEDRDYFRSGDTEEERGAVARASYALGPRTTVGIYADWTRYGFAGSERNDEFSRGEIWATRRIGRRLSVTLTLRHAERHTDFGVVSPLYKENAAILQLGWSPEEQ